MGPLKKKLALINSILNLYKDCFAKRCTPKLSCIEEKGGRLNEVCYMFWDICAEWDENDASKKDLEAAALQVLSNTLLIDHRACREGALHGLGHKKHDHPEQVERIIDGFLKDHAVDEALSAYAKQARTGMIL